MNSSSSYDRKLDELTHRRLVAATHHTGHSGSQNNEQLMDEVELHYRTVLAINRSRQAMRAVVRHTDRGTASAAVRFQELLRLESLADDPSRCSSRSTSRNGSCHAGNAWLSSASSQDTATHEREVARGNRAAESPAASFGKVSFSLPGTPSDTPASPHTSRSSASPRFRRSRAATLGNPFADRHIVSSLDHAALRPATTLRPEPASEPAEQSDAGHADAHQHEADYTGASTLSLLGSPMSIEADRCQCNSPSGVLDPAMCGSSMWYWTAGSWGACPTEEDSVTHADRLVMVIC